MNSPTQTKFSFLNICHPYLLIGCILSCAVCTIVMIWGVYAMRIDMIEMRHIMTSNTSMNMSPAMNMESQDAMSMSM